jgi:hypothetical protein
MIRSDLWATVGTIRLLEDPGGLGLRVRAPGRLSPNSLRGRAFKVLSLDDPSRHTILTPEYAGH